MYVALRCGTGEYSVGLRLNEATGIKSALPQFLSDFAYDRTYLSKMMLLMMSVMYIDAVASRQDKAATMLR